MDDQITIFTALCVFFVPSLLRFKTTVQKEMENELGAIKRKKTDLSWRIIPVAVLIITGGEAGGGQFHLVILSTWARLGTLNTEPTA